MNFFSLLSIVFLSFTVQAQVIEFGAQVGGTNSFDDINTISSFSTVRPAGGLLGRMNFNDRIAAKMQISHGRTFSSDAQFTDLALNTARLEETRTTFTDVSFTGEFNFFSFNGGAFQNSNKMTPYLAAGIGFSFLKPQIRVEPNGEFVNANSLLGEDERDFQSFQYHIPVAAGFKYNIDKKFNMGAEFSSRLLFTDYFDDISTVYNQNNIDNSPGNITTPGFQRGDRSRNDVYNVFGINATYMINLRTCKKWR